MSYQIHAVENGNWKVDVVCHLFLVLTVCHPYSDSEEDIPVIQTKFGTTSTGKREPIPRLIYIDSTRGRTKQWSVIKACSQYFINIIFTKKI